MTASPWLAPHLCYVPLLGALLGIAPPTAATAVELNLSHRFQPGQTYELSIRSETRTDGSSRGPGRPTFNEEVIVDYAATVIVLETDAAGRPLREQHQDVSVSFTRPGEAGSLFTAPPTLDVERMEGEVRVFSGGRRVPEQIERVLGAQLAHGPDRSDLADWLAPGRPVEIGESWALGTDFARRLLKDRGLRGRLAGAPTATLEQRDDRLAIHYTIPVSRIRLDDLPPNAVPSRSQGALEGVVGVPDAAGDRLLEHSSRLSLEMRGAVRTFGVTIPFGWQLEREEQLANRMRLLPQVAVQR
jgi:hypothetical protein